MERKELASKSLDELADWKAMVGRDSPNDQVADSEFMRRQTEAAIMEATAAEETAQFTRRNARYMLWSVIVLAVSSLATFLLTLCKH